MGFQEIASDKIKEMRLKIKKLLTLSKDAGATEGESQASMLMAQKLMMKYDIEEQEALNEAADDAKAFMRKKEAYHKPVTDYMDLAPWQLILANVIAENFKCFNYRQHWKGDYNSTEKGKKRIVFLGIKEETLIACEVFEFAWKAIEYLSVEYMEKRNDVPKNMKRAVKNDYILGYIDGLKDKFKEQVTELQLVLVHDALVVAEHDKLALKNFAIRTNSAGDAHARNQGFVDGKNFNHGSKRLT